MKLSIASGAVLALACQGRMESTSELYCYQMAGELVCMRTAPLEGDEANSECLPPGDGELPPEHPPIPCFDAPDCPSGELCVEGICVGDGGTGDTCVAVEDCATGLSCDGGFCVPPDYPECPASGDCKYGICQPYGCAPPHDPIACVGDGDCPSGDVCVNGWCQVAGTDPTLDSRIDVTLAATGSGDADFVCTTRDDDGDGVGNVLDPDDDGDGVSDNADTSELDDDACEELFAECEDAGEGDGDGGDCIDGACEDDDGEIDLPYDIKMALGQTYRPILDAFAEKGAIPDEILAIEMEGSDWRMAELQGGLPFQITQADCDHAGNRDVGRDRVFVTWRQPDGSTETDHLDLRYCEE